MNQTPQPPPGPSNSRGAEEKPKARRISVFIENFDDSDDEEQQLEEDLQSAFSSSSSEEDDDEPESPSEDFFDAEESPTDAFFDAPLTFETDGEEDLYGVSDDEEQLEGGEPRSAFSSSSEEGKEKGENEDGIIRKDDTGELQEDGQVVGSGLRGFLSALWIGWTRNETATANQSNDQSNDEANDESNNQPISQPIMPSIDQLVEQSIEQYIEQATFIVPRAPDNMVEGDVWYAEGYDSRDWLPPLTRLSIEWGDPPAPRFTHRHDMHDYRAIFMSTSLERGSGVLESSRLRESESAPAPDRNQTGDALNPLTAAITPGASAGTDSSRALFPPAQPGDTSAFAPEDTTLPTTPEDDADDEEEEEDDWESDYASPHDSRSKGKGRAQGVSPSRPRRGSVAVRRKGPEEKPEKTPEEKAAAEAKQEQNRVWRDLTMRLVRADHVESMAFNREASLQRRAGYSGFQAWNEDRLELADADSFERTITYCKQNGDYARQNRDLRVTNNNAQRRLAENGYAIEVLKKKIDKQNREIDSAYGNCAAWKKAFEELRPVAMKEMERREAEAKRREQQANGEGSSNDAETQTDDSSDSAREDNARLRQIVDGLAQENRNMQDEARANEQRLRSYADSTAARQSGSSTDAQTQTQDSGHSARDNTNLRAIANFLLEENRTMQAEIRANEQRMRTYADLHAEGRRTQLEIEDQVSQLRGEVRQLREREQSTRQESTRQELFRQENIIVAGPREVPAEFTWPAGTLRPSYFPETTEGLPPEEKERLARWKAREDAMKAKPGWDKMQAEALRNIKEQCAKLWPNAATRTNVEETEEEVEKPEDDAEKPEDNAEDDE